MVVALGASAGGLEAIEAFLRNVPPASGAAFVVIQHLDPTREGALPALLARTTQMPVLQVENGMQVEADHVYVIPPNKELSLVRGALRVTAPGPPRGLRLPIDVFLRSLADDRGPEGAAVILSGMGTDGTLGLKAVKEAGGLVLVQDPSSAQFDSMPRSAIKTRLVDAVAPPQDLPARLFAALGQPRESVQPDAELVPRHGSTVERILVVLRTRLGRDFSQYKRSTMERRIARRMALQQLSKPEDYLRYLQANSQEQDLLFHELLIGVTSFFRDRPVWDTLRNVAIPGLLAQHPKGGQLRAWIPACSTGEEAYSLAIVFREAVEKLQTRASYSLQIFATDLDPHAIAQARHGVYPANIASDVSAGRLRRFFVREHDGVYRVVKEIRESVVLAQQDVIRDPPFTRMDLVICRNLLIYLEPALQRRLITLFHYSLRPGGILLLGTSETLCGLTGLFTPVDQKLRIYSRKAGAARADTTGLVPVAAPTEPSGPREPATTRPSLQAAADELVLRQFGPPAVLVSAQGDILYLNGSTGKYLEPAAGKANWNVFAMAREGLRQPLSAALRSALRRGRPTTVRRLTVRTDGKEQLVEVTVKPLQIPEQLRGTCLIVFRDARGAARGGSSRKTARGSSRASELKRDTRRLQEELRNSQEDMQTTQEELRSANEELQSANEELQSTNEELQSTNEELTTSKEEMQSMNEELQTVNSELQGKVDELSRTGSDMRNLLNSTEIATIFLDSQLCLRRYTEKATRILRLIPTDVGRPVTDVRTDLVFPDLGDVVAQVLRTLVPIQREVATLDGQWFSTRVLPYRTLDDVIDGVVITFMDITPAKQLEDALRQSRERFGALLERLPAGVAVMDSAGRLVPRDQILASLVTAPAEDVVRWRVVAGPTVVPSGGGPS